MSECVDGSDEKMDVDICDICDSEIYEQAMAAASALGKVAAASIMNLASFQGSFCLSLLSTHSVASIPARSFTCSQ